MARTDGAKGERRTCRTARTAEPRGQPNRADSRTARTAEGREQRTARTANSANSVKTQRSRRQWNDDGTSEHWPVRFRVATYRDLDVLDAADLLADDVNRLLDSTIRHLIHRAQLRDCAGSIGANIAEGMTRRTLEGRNSCLDVSRGEANETIRHLRANYASGRITPATFFGLRNRLVTIDKMLARLQRSRFAEPAAAVVSEAPHRHATSQRR